MDSRIDPLTGDYDRTRIDTIANAIYLRITVPLGSYWADPTLGSRLHELRRSKDIERNRILAVQYTREALQPLIDAKRADRFDINAVWSHDGRLQILGEAYQHGRVIAPFNHYVKVA